MTMSPAEPKPYPIAERPPNFPTIEEAIIGKWEREDTFEASLALRPTMTETGESNEYVFYDGPPFANGLPHYGHLVTSFVKDVVPRYWTMRGRHVDRVFGWDCHGLPAELEVEKQLGMSGRTAILEYGIANFNQRCAESALSYTREWEWYVRRCARWVSFDRSYRTMDPGFMESVIWGFKTLWDKDLIYEGYRVVPYSWAAQTPVSHFETRLDDSYRTRADPGLTVGLKLLPIEPEDEPGRLLIWTTTPWTLPSNLAVAVGPEIEYADIRSEKFGRVTLARTAVERYARDLGEVEVLSTMPGSALAGRRYEPLFPYFVGTENAFQVLLGQFVSVEDGTGIVHMAPGFGEDDLNLCQAAGIPVIVPVDDAGRFTEAVPDYAGLNVIYEGNQRIIQDLKVRGDTVLRHEQVLHEYPHCWRTDEPLIYRAINSWFVAVTKFKDRMVELNHRHINWSPSTVRDGQFGKWLENARDWNISRNRFWGSPVPVWQSDDPAYPRTDVYGSIAELEAAFGVAVKDLHRPSIDGLVRPNPDDPTGRSMMRRVPEVLDCWFESGSMPFAQLHYPFENKERFDRNFPGDFIVEYVAQTRGWFYTLMVLSTALFDRAAFLNCVCHGVVLGDDNQKQSKRLKNYPDPVEVLGTHGADALRWLMLASPLMSGGNLAMDRDGSDIGKTSRSVILRLWNAYVFFTLYANIDGAKGRLRADSPHMLDRYILAKTRDMISTIQDRMDAYDLQAAYECVPTYIEALNNWYIRNRRDRFWADRHEVPDDKQAAYDTLYTCLVLTCRALAPLMPMISERIYTALVGVEGPAGSVHLSDWPDIAALPKEDVLVRRMDLARDVCSAVLRVRETHQLRTRLPLTSLTVAHPEHELLKPVVDVISDEVNVKKVVLTHDLARFGRSEIRVDPSLGKVYGAKMQAVFAAQRRGEWKMHDDGRVSIGGIVLESSQYELRVRSDAGAATGSFDNGRGVVVLDTTVTPELQAEGWARDVVRLVQNARKGADLELTDRIHLDVWTEEPVRAALHTHSEYIARETLAAEFDFDADFSDLNGGVILDQLDGRQIKLKVARLQG
jgi:isoleucyl-tRNA synthetase